jgi:hypothetical protein
MVFASTPFTASIPVANVSTERRELVVRWISTVGNYDYIFDWVFHDNGSSVAGIFFGARVVHGFRQHAFHRLNPGGAGIDADGISTWRWASPTSVPSAGSWWCAGSAPSATTTISLTGYSTTTAPSASMPMVPLIGIDADGAVVVEYPVKDIVVVADGADPAHHQLPDHHPARRRHIRALRRAGI